MKFVITMAISISVSKILSELVESGIKWFKGWWASRKECSPPLMA